MSDKTFKERVRDEMKDFAEIYEFFRSDLEARTADGMVDDNWLHLFGVPFNGTLSSEPADRKAARNAWKIPHKHDAVRKAIHELGVGELRLGPLIVKDLRVSAALDLGLLTPNDVVPPSKEKRSKLEEFAERLKPDQGDPIFWRTLLEVLCRAVTASRGRPPWALPLMMDLAFDLYEIRRDYEGRNKETSSRNWTADDFIAELRASEYADKYPKAKSAGGQQSVGIDRIQQIIGLVGPMDIEALRRLRNLFPDEFHKTADRRWYREMETQDGLLYALGDAQDIIDAITSPDDEASATAGGR